ncbi:ATP-binding protein [Rhodococcus sp. 2G]|uniref:ATP-binding protein n=1 Tax=Rhodococcus sp. 2G TaxID=1570939 RepID=UPI0012EC8B18|nr:ATP-binding protein [Rhodococcus sp. 2G]
MNGAFGAGKTTVARRLAGRFPNSVMVDPEEVGSILRSSLQKVSPRSDFQDWKAWRRLSVELIASIAAEVPGTLIIVPQTVLIEKYWEEISSGLSSRVRLLPVSLHVGLDVHTQRVHTDQEEPDALRWRLHRYSDYQQASWISHRFNIVDNNMESIDLTVDSVAKLIPC